MNNDLDTKLYNEYLNGKQSAFEALYIKYRNSIQYFVFNIIKDYHKAEDITQEVFIYVFKNKEELKSNFKYYIYLIAKSKTLNYLNTKNRRENIVSQYFSDTDNQFENDVSEIITREETNKEIVEAINELDNRYRNAMYLVKVEELSYKEVAEILDESLQNIKNLVHRGKKELQKILIKKGLREVNKVSKVLIVILCSIILLSGIAYAAYKIYEKKADNGNSELTPTFTSKISNIDTNKIWVGTFNLVWNDLMDEVIGGPIEFEEGESELAKELNKQTFTKKELSEKSYFKIHGGATTQLKEKIEKQIKNKFNENSKILDYVEWDNPNCYVLYSMLKKEFTYLETFPTLTSAHFNNSEEKVKYFGITSSTPKTATKNVEVLFYNSKEDFAVKLKTKEGEEVLLYKTSGEGKSFEENYNEMTEKGKKYSGEKLLLENEQIKIPFIKISSEINYDELCGKFIKGTDWYIRQALQTVDFELNDAGGSVKSEALIEMLKNAEEESKRWFDFDSDFILYLKEENKEKPYLALKVDNTEVLVKAEKN